MVMTGAAAIVPNVVVMKMKKTISAEPRASLPPEATMPR